MIILYIFLLIAHVIATAWFYIQGVHISVANYAFNLTTTLFVVIPFLHCLLFYKKYPRLRAITICLMIGQLCFLIAQAIWFYFNMIGSQIPYPSLADIFFLLYYPANLLALIFISRSGEYTWNISNYVIFLSLSAVLGVFIFTFLSEYIDFSAPLPVLVLNLTYPILDSILAAFGLTVLRSQSHLGYRYLFLFVFGYILIGIGDTLFAYQTTIGTYWNGNFVDLTYVIAHAGIALGTIYLPSLVKSTEMSVD